MYGYLTPYKQAPSNTVHLTRHTVCVLSGVHDEPRDIKFTSPPVRTLGDMTAEEIMALEERTGAEVFDRFEFKL